MSGQLFGVETELAVAAEHGDGSPLPVEEVLSLFSEMARNTLRHLPDERGGMFLENAARLYRDSAGSVDHIEYATPETVNPWDTVRYILAGEEIMLNLAQRVRESQPELGCVRVMKHNANYGQLRGAAWGTHESYLHRCPLDRLHENLVPFLVSRIIFTGAGGFDPLSPGIKFLISPRVAHLAKEISGDTTHDRPIYNTKNESLCGDAEGWRRLHLVCGESNCSETSMWLKTATTAMVVAMIGEGIPVGEGVRLVRPLEAMKRFAGDAGLKRAAKRLAGSLVSPLQMQRHYLSHAEANLHKEFMPDWSSTACTLWHTVLDALERGGAAAVATRLDWAIKYVVFGRHLAHCGFTWGEAERLTRIAGRLQRALERQEYGASGMRGIYLEPRHLLNPCPEISGALLGVDQQKLVRFLEVRDELFELDLRFMTAGPGGLFRQLESRGALQHQVPGVDDIAHAMEGPPQGSRALLRGQTVKELSQLPDGNSALCMWNMVRTPDRVLDLRDPFETTPKWTGGSAQDMELITGLPTSIFRYFQERMRA